MDASVKKRIPKELKSEYNKRYYKKKLDIINAQKEQIKELENKDSEPNTDFFFHENSMTTPTTPTTHQSATTNPIAMKDAMTLSTMIWNGAMMAGSSLIQIGLLMIVPMIMTTFSTKPAEPSPKPLPQQSREPQTALPTLSIPSCL